MYQLVLQLDLDVFVKALQASEQEKKKKAGGSDCTEDKKDDDMALD